MTFDCYNDSIRTNPNYALAFWNKGLALCILAKYGEAIKCFDDAIRIDKNYFQALYNKGIALVELKKNEEVK